jgi:hypothetical protein
VRFGLEGGGVAVEPIDPAVGCEVRLIQNTPDTRTTHGPEAPLMEGGDQGVKAPVRGRAGVRWGFPGGHRQPSQTRGGGKAPRSPRTRRIWQATEALRTVATAPTAHSMAVTVEVLGSRKVRRVVRCGTPQEQPATPDQGLGGGMGAPERRQMSLFIVTSSHVGRTRDGHRRTPEDKGDMATHAMPIPYSARG